jgi:hypothetical protein
MGRIGPIGPIGPLRETRAPIALGRSAAVEGDGGEVVGEDGFIRAGDGGDGAVQKVGGGDGACGKVAAEIVWDEPGAVGADGAVKPIGVEEEGVACGDGGAYFLALERCGDP